MRLDGSRTPLIKNTLCCLNLLLALTALGRFFEKRHQWLELAFELIADFVKLFELALERFAKVGQRLELTGGLIAEIGRCLGLALVLVPEVVEC